MFSKLTQMLVIFSLTASLTVPVNHDFSNESINIPQSVEIVETVAEDSSDLDKVVEFKNAIKELEENLILDSAIDNPDPVVEEVVAIEEPVVEEIDYGVTDEEIELLALVTMAEAEGECEEGKRLVIDTVLNRVDSELGYFPDTIEEVIYQKNAFSAMWGDRVNVEVTDEVRELVKEELLSRTNTEVMYFRTKHYSKYGTPMYPVGNHYFSSN